MSISKEVNKELDRFEKEAELFLANLFEKRLAKIFARKIRGSKIECIDYSMGTYFVKIKGREGLFSESKLEDEAGLKKESNILNEIIEVIDSDNRTCDVRCFDPIEILNKLI